VPVSIVVPQLGESIVEGTISKWLKKEGDSVRRDEPVVEIMTDKITVEVPSPEEGTLGRIVVAEGETIPVGVEIAVILKAGETLGEATAAAVSAPASASAAAPASAPSAPAPSAHAPTGAAPARTNSDAPGFLSPVVRRLAREHNVDPATVRGTGRGGRITREDILSLIERKPGRPASPAAPLPTVARVRHGATAAGPREEVVPIAGLRKVISDRMTRSKFTAVHCTSLEEADVSAIVRLREDYRDRIEQQEGVRLTYTPFFIKAAALALEEFPKLNATWQGDDAVVVKRYYNIGVAVGRDEGLVVPVVKDAGAKSLLDVARAVSDLSARAQANRLTLDDLQGGTFSVTNAGLFGSFASTPIINYPEVAILGVHKIAERPTVVHGQLAVRPMTNLALTFDHRWIDGHMAVQFLVRLKEILERPELFWLGI
jgi:2-oxoglutarate dehydrogenase complex dihydrolipoamide succinyltransferase (E2) component